MVEYSKVKRRASGCDCKTDEYPSKKPKLSAPPATTTCSRPLSEPPILSYFYILESVHEELKSMKERPSHLHPDTRIAMARLGWRIEDQVLDMYLDWAAEMYEDAVLEDSHEPPRFYRALMHALREDIEQHSKERHSIEEGWDSESSIERRSLKSSPCDPGSVLRISTPDFEGWDGRDVYSPPEQTSRK